MNEVFHSIRPSQAHAHTGERMSQGHNLETELEHFHRYYLARQFAAGLDVLDIASGEGYGSALIAQVARSVVGVDLDPSAVAHASATYGDERLRFIAGSATAIPLADASVDLLVSFETLEHFADHGAFFREAKRVLRPPGRLVISTPDRDVYSPAGSPPNPYHVRELNRAEFATLLDRHFAHHALLGQRVLVGSALVGIGEPRATPLVFDRLDPDEVSAAPGLPRARYFVAVASDEELGMLPDSLFIETSDLSAFTAQIPWLRQEIAERIAIQDAEKAQHRDAIAHYEAALARLNASYATAEQEDVRRTEDLLFDLVRLKAALAQSEAERGRLQGLWPRAELQRLALALAAEQAERTRLDTDLAAVQASTLWRLAAPLRRLEPHGAPAKWLRLAMRAQRLLRTGRARLALRRQRRADMAVLAGHALFDHEWYRSQYLAAQPGTDPVAHYLWLGAAAGHDPHPLFDTTWYAAHHPELGLANPYADYLRRGMAADEDPHPLFDTRYYLGQAPEAAGKALAHYAARTGADPRSPTRCFDMLGYRADNPDITASRLDPLAHFARIGAAQDRNPHALFDTAWYRRTHLAGAPGINPLAHWLRKGAAAGVHPHRLFPGVTPDHAAVRLPSHDDPAVSIIIPVYGRVLDTTRCLYALARTRGDIAFEVILADDRPADPIAPLLSWVPGLRAHLNPVNMGFLRNCNGSARLARGKHLVFLNNDTIADPDWLQPLVRVADGDPAIGMVGSKLLNADGTLQEAGGALLADGWGRPYGAGQDPTRPEYNFVREVDVVIGACMLIPRTVWDALGGFDDRYAPAYYEEFDFAFALRDRGLKVLYQPASVVTHLDGSSYGTVQRDVQSSRNHRQFCAKWARALAQQPLPGTPDFLTRSRPPHAGTLLMLEDRVPESDKNAGSLATAQYVSLLVRLGLRVVYYPHDGAAPSGYTEALQQQGVEILHHPVVLTEWLRENGRHLDWVWASRPYVSGHVMQHLRRDTGAPIFYLTHDLHHVRETRRYEIARDPMALDEARRLRAIEEAIFATADRILTFSEDEARTICEAVPSATVHVLPLFFFDAREHARPCFAGRHGLLFVGGFNHVPNIDAALWLVREIMPELWRSHPNATVDIVGAKPPDEVLALAGPNVRVMGHVPDLAPCYARARISINPLRFGAGVKGKIVASLAAGLPVVTTPVGNEGIRLAGGTEALIADTPAGLAAHIAALLDDDERCAAMAQAGAAVIAQRFSRNSAETAIRDLLGLQPGNEEQP